MKALFGFTFVVGLSVLGCAKDGDNKPLGTPAPANTPTATIEQLVSDKSLIGKTVVIEGTVGGVGCADCGGVLVTDKTWRILVEPEDTTKFKIPAHSGAKIRAWGVVQVDDEEGEEKAKTGDKKAEGGEKKPEVASIALKARGVEWK